MQTKSASDVPMVPIVLAVERVHPAPEKNSKPHRLSIYAISSRQINTLRWSDSRVEASFRVPAKIFDFADDIVCSIGSRRSNGSNCFLMSTGQAEVIPVSKELNRVEPLKLLKRRPALEHLERATVFLHEPQNLSRECPAETIRSESHARGRLAWRARRLCPPPRGTGRPADSRARNR